MNIEEKIEIAETRIHELKTLISYWKNNNVSICETPKTKVTAIDINKNDIKAA